MALVGTSLLLSACAANWGPGSAGAAGGAGGGESVPYGAPKEDFIAALEDMSPVTIAVPSSAASGAVGSLSMDMFKAEVEEWSGGAITVEIGYGNSLGALPEMKDALRDGRVGMGNFAPIYEPDAFPANNALMDLTFLGPRTTIVGGMVQTAANAEVGFATPEIMAEIENAGIEPLVPVGGGGATVGILCNDPATTLDDFRGRQVRVTGRGHVGAVSAIGATPVSLPMSEIYEGMQRGVVDCAEALLTTLNIVGVVELAPNYTVAQDQPGVGFPGTPTTFGANPALWDSLPLAAQQLLHDKWMYYTEGSLISSAAQEAEAVRAMKGLGGTFEAWSPDVAEALARANQETLEATKSNPAIGDAAGMVSAYEESVEKWTRIITEELGYTEDPPLEELADRYEPDQIDYGPFLERFWEEVMLEHRPS